MKKYNVIYADPPWNQKAGPTIGKYTKNEFGVQIFPPNEVNTSKDLPYQTMTVQNICDLPVKSITMSDAHLYMWVTNKYLMEAQQVLKAWGFKYSTTLVWAKKPLGGGLGGTFKVSTEFLIFATKGSLKSIKQIKGTWFEVKRPYVNGYPCHSKKPDFFAELIESVSPGEKLEMFARNERPGWDVFGNEVNNSITL